MGRLPLRSLSAALLVAGCVSVSFDTNADRAYRAGDMEEAARAYRQVLDHSTGGSREAHALYRLALIHSRPDSLLRDDAEAAQLLRRLLQDHPDSRYAPQATLILDLQRQASQLQEMSDELAASIQELRAQTARAVTALQDEMGTRRGRGRGQTTTDRPARAADRPAEGSARGLQRRGRAARGRAAAVERDRPGTAALADPRTSSGLRGPQ